AVSALHFYESKGLIASRRTSGNQRRFSRDTLRRVAFIRAAQRVGIPLATIREALARLPEERTPTREDWARLSEAWRSELDERIRQLNRLRDHLTDCIGCGCLSLDSCVLSNPDDVLDDRLTGSRLLAESPRPARGAARPRSGIRRTGRRGRGSRGGTTRGVVGGGGGAGGRDRGRSRGLRAGSGGAVTPPRD